MSARVLVIGAGPAGMSAALWLHDLEVPFRWVDAADAVGGTLNRVGNPVPNYLGFSAANGPELAGLLTADLVRSAITPQLGIAVDSLSAEGTAWRASLGNGEVAVFDAVLVCTGTRPRRLGFPQEISHAGRGVEISVTRNVARYAGRSALVVGGGDAAVEGALLLAPHCPVVYVVHRRERFRAQTRFLEELEQTANIVLHTSSELRAIRTGGDRVLGVTLQDGTDIDAEGVFVRIGVQPALPEGVEGQITGEDGYVDAAPTGRTSLTGIYAAGDVTSRDHQSVAWAVGSAGRAVRAIADDLGLSR